MKIPNILARTILAIVATAGSLWILSAQQPQQPQRPAVPYTQEQAAAGRIAYQANCVSCHAADLNGREGPQLAGANFIAQWGDRTAGELIKYMQAAMPPGAAPLPGDSYAGLAAFILDANGARARAPPAGTQALTAASNVTIRSVASGQRAAYLQAGATRGRPNASNGHRQASETRQAGAPRPYRRGRSEELRPRHRRHAAQSGSRPTG